MFTFVLFIFIFCVLTTLTSFKEIPLNILTNPFKVANPIILTSHIVFFRGSPWLVTQMQCITLYPGMMQMVEVKMVVELVVVVVEVVEGLKIMEQYR